MECEHLYIGELPIFGPLVKYTLLRYRLKFSESLISDKPMSDLRKLENLYNEKIKIDDREASYYRGLLRHLLELLLIPEMKRVTPDFSALYSHTYFGGSTFDGLKVKTKTFLVSL